MPARHHESVILRDVAPVTPVAIGKFARDAEYLRPPPSPSLTRFDSWLNEGFELADERLGATWPALFGMGAPYGFVWRAGEARESRSFYGVVAPSQDAVGRAYPLALGASAWRQQLESDLHLVPLATGDFLDDSYAALAEARAGLLSRVELERRLEQVPFPSDGEIAGVARDYDEWCATTDADAGWAAAFPSEDSAAVARRALGLLREARSSDGNLAARLPVGDSPAGASALWLDALARLFGPAAITSALWAVYDGSLFAAVGVPPADLVTSLWARGVATPAVLDLTGESWRRSTPASPQEAGRKCTLHSFLETLSTAARR